MDAKIEDRFSRCRLLFGENFAKIESAKIIIFGVGGVGSFCLDALYRTGVRDITIVDSDIYEVTNQNRQIGSENLGVSKVETLSCMYKDVKPLHLLVTPKWIDEFDFSKFDVVIDAIDDIPCKIALANKTANKLISSMGSAKRVSPAKIKVADIWKTDIDPFARKIRVELRKKGFKVNYPCVFSTEEPKTKELGSFVGVTGSFGLMLASLAIEKCLDKNLIYSHTSTE